MNRIKVIYGFKKKRIKVIFLNFLNFLICIKFSKTIIRKNTDLQYNLT